MKIMSTSLLFTLVLAACARQEILVTGEVMPAIDPENVRIYLADKPSCDFYQIANIRIPGEKSQAGLVDSFKRTAAQYGAPIIQVTSIQKLNPTEYMGTARALRCVPVQIDGFNHPLTSTQ